MTPSEEDIEALMSGQAPGDGYIGKDNLTGIVSIESDEPLSDDLLEKMRSAIRVLSDDRVAERVRKLEAIRNEHEVQERARVYRQVDGLVPAATHYFDFGDEDAPGYLWDLLRGLDGFDKATVTHEFTANRLRVVVSKHGPEFEVG